MSSYVQPVEVPPGMEDRSLKAEVGRLKSAMERQGRLLKSLGFEVGPSAIGIGRVFYHQGLKRCRCKRPPQIQEDIDEKGKWLVICPDCQIRTESNPKVMDAMRDWQKNKYTELSEMMLTPWGKETE